MLKSGSSVESAGPIGVFDSGFGGLSILEHMRAALPQYDYIYLGDNARTPYGSRSFKVVYEYTCQCVDKLFQMGCNLVILACNTASAKALRTIQQKDLGDNPQRRVLGIIRPTAECVGNLTSTGHVGILATPGTVKSDSYVMEIGKLFPNITVCQQACPLLVPLVESGEFVSPGADYFVKKYVDALLAQDHLIDAIILGCTHYPLLYDRIRRFVPNNISIVTQGDYVTDSLKDYLQRHALLEAAITKNGTCRYFTTESEETFLNTAKIFLKDEINVSTVVL